MKRLLMIMALAALVPTTLLAQERRDRPDYGPWTGDWELTLSATGTNDNDFDSKNYGGNVGLGYYLTPGWEVGIRQAVTFSDSNDSSSKWSGATRGFIDYNFDLVRFRPYIGLNLGGVYGDSVDDSFAAGPEVGLKYYADYHTFVYGGVEYAVLFDEVSDLDETFDDGNFVYSIGIGFNF